MDLYSLEELILGWEKPAEHTQTYQDGGTGDGLALIPETTKKWTKYVIGHWILCSKAQWPLRDENPMGWALQLPHLTSVGFSRYSADRKPSRAWRTPWVQETKQNERRSQQPAVTEQRAAVKEFGDCSRYSAERSSAHACEGTLRPRKNHQKRWIDCSRTGRSVVSLPTSQPGKPDSAEDTEGLTQASGINN